MTENEKEALFNEKYAKWYKFLLDYQSNYEKHLHLSHEKRLELEKKVADLVDFCNENGIYMHESNDIFQFMISLKDDGSRELNLNGFSICTKVSCYASVLLDETEEELKAHAKSNAEMDVQLAERHEQEEEEKRKQEAADKAEYERRYKEACKRNAEMLEELRAAEEMEELHTLHVEHADEIKRAKEFNQFVTDDLKRQNEAAKSYVPKSEEELKAEKIEELQAIADTRAEELNDLLKAREEKLDEDASNDEKDEMTQLADDVFKVLHGDSEVDKAVNALIEQVNAYANFGDYDILNDFNVSMCTHDELEALDEYILQCQRFTDAQNMGLTGLGLYTFNNDRMKAHEQLLEAWGLDDYEIAVSATKSFDFCSDWNYKTHKYDARPKDEAELMLGWVLWKCRCVREADEKRD